ncbi:MAG TPA: glycogen debranching protein GlgX, partial [Thermomicrobiales bacterium]|nr:glycogen debranching protein GlgX [Thermomicrobiales bacterium]
WDGERTQFHVWSPSADKVELCLFDRDDHSRETERVEMTNSDGTWSAAVDHAPPGTPYGYRATGPYKPSAGLRFNPAKLLVDPYARSITSHLVWNPAVLSYPLGKPDAKKPNSDDSAPFVLRSIVVDESFDWEGTKRPATPLEDTIIYETHVKGLTELHPDVPVELRGTYAGAAHPAVIGYLRDLGITAIEFLPVHTHVDDGFLVERGLAIYWGYNTLGFFSPHAAYAAASTPGAEVAEFKAMVREYHRAGIEVFLDVVYNHTAESSHQGPTLSFRGLHNAEFYWLSPDDQSKYFDLTGTGNTVKVDHAYVTNFVLDSLRYWVNEMGVDGFRFDLAPVLGRTETDFDRHAPIFEQIEDDRSLRDIKMIAEPWDVGPGGYQVGGFPDNWSEWNDRYRDVVRSFWRSDDGKLNEMGFRLTGSADFYGARGFGPCASINFVAAHDGMTIWDLTAYQDKRNYANGDNNQDGHDNDVNQYLGPDGPTSEPDVVAARMQRVRALLATLLVSRGVPMILGGDEFGRTQLGNNNAYCQDNPISWIDWTLREENAGLVAFVRDLIALRKSEPALRIARFPDDAVEEEDPWIWFDEAGNLMTEDEWNNPKRRSFGIFLDGEGNGAQSPLVLLFNAGGDELTFVLPKEIDAVDGSIELVLTTIEGERNPLVAPPGSLSAIRLKTA